MPGKELRDDLSKEEIEDYKNGGMLSGKGGAGNKARAIRDEERSRRQACGGQEDEWTGLVCDEGVPTQRVLIGECRANLEMTFSLLLQQRFPNFFFPNIIKTLKTY